MEVTVEVEIEGEEEEQARPNTSLTLVGRFLTDRPIRSHIMKERMAGVWRPGSGVNIREARSGTFLFQFFHPLDLERVLKQGPWSFDKHLLILCVIPDGVAPNEVPLFQIPFWVQVHNIPNGFMSEAVGKHVGNTIGSFLEYDPKNTSEFWCLFMRVRVLLDVRKPLLKKLKLRKPGGDAKEVVLKYETLDIFCYMCGMLGHLDNSCNKLFDLVRDDSSRNWGPEIKAEVRRGGSSSGARWLREEGLSWTAPNQGLNVGSNHGISSPIIMHGNKEGLMAGSNGITTARKEGNNEGNNGVEDLVEIFKNPSILFQQPRDQHVIMPNKINVDNMEADVAIEGDRKRMREQALERGCLMVLEVVLTIKK